MYLLNKPVKPVRENAVRQAAWYGIGTPRVMGPWYEVLDENYAVILLDS